MDRDVSESSYNDSGARWGAADAEARKKHRTADDCNVYRLNNTIYFSDRITYTTASELIKVLRIVEGDIMDDVRSMDGEVRKSKVKYAEARIDPKPILLHLTTLGGLVHAALAVVDCISTMRVPVHTIITGYVASAGTLISLAGTKRLITANAFMMIHEIRSGFWGRYSDARVEHENLTKLMEHVTKYYVENTKITREKLTEMLRTDTDLTPAEALELGLVDEVLK